MLEFLSLSKMLKLCVFIADIRILPKLHLYKMCSVLSYINMHVFFFLFKARLLPPEDNGGSTGSQTSSNTVNLRNTNKKRNRCCSGSSADDEALTEQATRRSGAIPRVAGYRSVSFPSS